MSSRPSAQFISAHDLADDGASEVGRQLREKRLACGLTVAQVASVLRIREHYLEALERGDLAALPGRPYAAGFVRAYAGHLGLDAERIVERVKPSIDRQVAAPMLPSVVPAAEHRSAAASILTAVLLLGAAAYVGIQAVGDRVVEDSVADLPVATVAEPPRPAAPPPDLLADALPPVAAPLPVVIAPPQVADAASAVAAELPAVDVPTPSVTAATDGPPPAEQLAAAAPIEDLEAGRVVLVALESSWFQVRSPSRDFIRKGTLEPGQRLTLPDRGDLTLWTGNAGGLQVEVDGLRVGLVGSRGAIVRGLPLTPDQLRQRLSP